jgi:hypothetical protein
LDDVRDPVASGGCQAFRYALLRLGLEKRQVIFAIASQNLGHHMVADQKNKNHIAKLRECERQVGVIAESPGKSVTACQVRWQLISITTRVSRKVLNSDRRDE